MSYTEVAAPSDALADSVGFDASYENNQYVPKVTQELEWSGIRHLRDGPPVTPTMINLFKGLGQHGINHAIGMEAGFAPSTLKAALAAFAPYVDYVEPANEADNVANPNWAQMRQDQQTLYSTVRANPAYNNVAVMGPSFANPAAHAALVGPLDAYEDYGQMHNATCDWNPATTLFGSGIATNIALLRVSTVYKPLVTTETGYGDDLTRGCSLVDSVIARYIPREAALRFMAGMPRTYYDFLVNRPYDAVFGSLGMLNFDGSPKPQFLTLANLVHITADPGAPIPSRQVTYGISGATSDVEHLMLARRDGSYELLLWRETMGWDHHARQVLAVAPETVGVSLPAGMKWAGMFKTSPSYGVTRVQLPVASGAISVPVDDTVTIVHIYGPKSTVASALHH